MTTRTLVEISPEPRTWDSQYGQMAAFRLTFEDGMKAELVTKAETVEKRRGELKAALGHPGEWVLEDQGAFPDGKPKPQKVKDYPGKPQAKGSGGGGGLSFEDRLKLDEATSEHMDIRTALMQAVAFHTGTPTLDGTVIQTATKYLGWLRAQRSVGAGPKGVGEGAGSSAPTDRTAAGEGEYNERATGSRRPSGDRADSGEVAPSAPAAVTTRAGDPSPPQERTPALPGDGLEVLAEPPPSPGTTRAGAPQPPQGEAPAPPGDGSMNYSESSPSPGTNPEKCSHPSWSPAPNELAAKRGVEVCDVCGHAEKRKASV